MIHPSVRLFTSTLVVAASLGVLFAAPPLHAEPAIFKDADVALGEKLMAEHRCAQCHAQKFGGDGNAVYRPLEKINTAGLLRGMVEQCNSTLNFQMFPEEVTAVAAALNRRHYRFKE